MSSKGFKITVFILLLFIAVVAGVAIFGEKGWVSYRHLAQAETQMQQRVADLREKNQQLTHEIYRLKHDKGYLERVIRQQLDMGKSDELVFKFR